jgi:pyrimidine deaminase RibD-like protein
MPLEASEDRKYMQMAVDQAKLSKGEPGKVSPLVGAVAVSADGAMVVGAHRGEMEPGDHAEFTALEKKLGRAILAGGTVYTTLEPCMRRGTTQDGKDKIPCAQRLIDRRVGRVVVGMLDPDPTVHGKGEMELLRSGIQVQRFDPDLTNEILEMNRDFVRDRRSLGFQITGYPNRSVPERVITVSGVYITKPSRPNSIYVFTRRNNVYWPQHKLAIKHDRTWECELDLGGPGDVGVLIARISDDIKVAVDLYYKVGRKHKDWIGWELPLLPDGIQVMHEIKVSRRDAS